MRADLDHSAESRADAILARIPQAEMDRLATALARLLISSARSGGKVRRVVPSLPLVNESDTATRRR